MKEVVLFGSIPLARKCLEFLCNKKNVKIIGVVTETNYRSEKETVAEYSIREDIPIINLEICKKLKPDFGFSIRFNQIFDPKVINSFKNGIINLHGGPLPYYKGSCNNIFAILNNEKNFGVTLHYIDKGVDTGDIIARSFFAISPKETGYSLYLKTIDEGFHLFVDNVDSIISLSNQRIAQTNMFDKNFSGVYYYTRKDLEKYRCLDIKKQEISYINRTVRAYFFPGEKGAYFKCGNRKIYLTL